MVYLYYFNSLKPILLNPYLKNNEIGNVDVEKPVTIYSANSLTKEDGDYIERKGFQDIDSSVNLWIQEKRYYPRLFISTFAFFIMYFLLSFAIRDPIPIIDELLGSFGFTFLTWSFFTKRDTKSAIAKKKKLEIKRQINKAKYDELNILNKIENFVFDLKARDNLDIADAIALVEGNLDLIIIDEEDKLYLDSIYYLLRTKFIFDNKNLESLYNKVKKVNDSGESDEALSSKLIELGKRDKNSLILIALLITLRKLKAK